ncbi:ubiquitin thioesterase otubain-like [Rhizoctonia solani]|uniref:Ubiquitin thioesterase otubain-like n=1 Tax=Rhizoctonia solani TaxID=456999 RepID=A0A8H8SV88_9AGAM|nr:ubiquitin thioesterase otubain-like [Rhizoctonia solani]QRW17893.1 ubiquitin thioesterase otubain-like [Rhizoctonia solani]
MSHTKVMYQRPMTTRDAISLRTTRPTPRKPRSSRSEIEEAQALVEDAFEILHSPASQEADSLATYRKKWDILRITLETTLYTTPINGSASKSNRSFVNGSSSGPIPRSPTSPRSKSPLDDPLLLSPPSLLGTTHSVAEAFYTGIRAS